MEVILLIFLTISIILLIKRFFRNSEANKSALDAIKFLEEDQNYRIEFADYLDFLCLKKKIPKLEKQFNLDIPPRIDNFEVLYYCNITPNIYLYVTIYRNHEHQSLDRISKTHTHFHETYFKVVYDESNSEVCIYSDGYSDLNEKIIRNDFSQVVLKSIEDTD